MNGRPDPSRLLRLAAAICLFIAEEIDKSQPTPKALPRKRSATTTPKKVRSVRAA